MTHHQRAYNRLQEAMRKDDERLYSVLTKRCQVALHPARFSSITHIVATGKAIAILHNMVVRERRDGFISLTRMAAAVDVA